MWEDIMELGAASKVYVGSYIYTHSVTGTPTKFTTYINYGGAAQNRTEETPIPSLQTGSYYYRLKITGKGGKYKFGNTEIIATQDNPRYIPITLISNYELIAESIGDNITLTLQRVSKSSAKVINETIRTTSIRAQYGSDRYTGHAEIQYSLYKYDNGQIDLHLRNIGTYVRRSKGFSFSIISLEYIRVNGRYIFGEDIRESLILFDNGNQSVDAASVNINNLFYVENVGDWIENDVLKFVIQYWNGGEYFYPQNLQISPIFFNEDPTVNLLTSNNQTLYENDTLIIDGSAIDNDADQSVTVYYQINDGPKKVLATNLSQTTIPFNKQLKFKNGKLYDGETAVSGNLTDGVAHTLKVWAQDSEGAESTPQTRTFYVVPNRAPTLTINEVVPSGNIDTDKFTVSGHAGDPDANANVTVTYRINENNSIQVYEGPGGAFSFDIALGQLVVGQNTIVVEVIDNYGAKTNKTIKLNKSAIKTPLLQSTARYKLEPPAGSAKGVLLYIQRDQNLVIDAKISMTLTGEPENFVAMTLENTAPLPNETTILEDEFYYETTEPKDNIILQVDMTRSSTDVNDKITLIQGAFD